jgi:putative heme-binding domain-containing protein
LLAQLGESGVARVKKELKSSDEIRRLVAYRALRSANIDVFAMATAMVKDTSPAIRREVALTMRDFRTPEAIENLVIIAKQYDGKDRSYLEAIGLGASGREPAVYEAISKAMGSTPDTWSPAFVGIVWRLHAPQSVAGVRERLLSGKLSPEAAKFAVNGLAFTQSHAAVLAMIELAQDKNFSQHALANWWLMNRKGNLWKPYDVEGLLKVRGLYDADKVVLTPFELSPVAADAPKVSIEKIAALKGDAARGKIAAGSCLACHRMGNEGIEYGPNLTGYAKNQSLETVIVGIAQPSSAISHGYEGSRLVTTDGIVITGMVLASGDPVIMKCMGGQIQTIPQKRVKEIKPLERSLMFYPSQLGLTDQSIADITEYLRNF